MLGRGRFKFFIINVAVCGRLVSRLHLFEVIIVGLQELVGCAGIEHVYGHLIVCIL